MCFIPLLSWEQTLLPFMDYNNFFQVFKDGNFNQVEHLAVNDLSFGDELVAYTNSQRDFKVYDGKKTQLLTNQIVQFKQSDHILAWNIGPIINYFENGKSHVLTSFGGDYVVGDSLLVYQDTRYGTLNVMYEGVITVLVRTTGDIYMPEVVGDNLLVFRDNGNVYKVFWRGQIIELGVWNGFANFEFFAGTDILAFNDPSTRTFAVFENGEFLDVEGQQVAKVKPGRGFIVYEDVQGNLKYYGRGERKELSSFNQFWDAKDDVVLWGESNSTFTLENGERKQVCNYAAKDWKLKNDVIALRSNLGGVAAYRKGNYKEITSISASEFVINGHGVLVTLSNKSVIAYYNNEIYRD